MWNDLQEAFFLLLAPFAQNILFPLFLAAALVLSLILPLINLRGRR